MRKLLQVESFAKKYDEKYKAGAAVNTQLAVGVQQHIERFKQCLSIMEKNHLLENKLHPFKNKVQCKSLITLCVDRG